MSTTATIPSVTPDGFTDQVLEASRTAPVVVDFWAPWCGPCHQLSPLLAAVASRYAGDVRVVKVNVDAAPALAQRYRVQGIPAVKAFRHGAVVAEFTGVQPEQVIDRFFAALAPSEADRLVAAAREAEGAAREQALRDALAADPGHPGAIAGLARVLIDRGERDEARRLLQRAPGDEEVHRLLAELDLDAAGARDTEALTAAADAGDVEAMVALGRALAADGAYADALERLLQALRRREVRDEAREAILSVFSVLGADHELVRAYRPRLAAALF